MDSSTGWQFWIDRGGTFTDVVARRPDGRLIVHKLLSADPEHYPDAVLQGIRDVLSLPADAAIPEDAISAIKMGTTVGTNGLLTRTGERTLLATTRGFRDQLRIGYQDRPEIFALQIILPQLLYERVIEIDERYGAHGEEIAPVDGEAARAALQQAYDDGVRSVAIVFMHGYRYPAHESQVAELAREVGFTHVSESHRVAPLMKLVSRGDTTVVNAYLSPLLKRYVEKLAAELSGPRLTLMQSNGGLADARTFAGKDSILSGPAGGIVGAVKVSQAAGFDRIISFDMGGTSTDVAHYRGQYERRFETEIAGVRLRTPMLYIHTVAAGGGSVLHFDGTKYRVGPDSAGANPGPACYRRGGPLTVTDCNVMLGKIQPPLFPKVFGPERNLPLDADTVRRRFRGLAAEIKVATGDARAPEQVAEGFIAVAVENMANAIKKISVQRGIHVAEYTLCCFGGAAGQHACLVADRLGIRRVLLHPLAGVLSAYGIGLAESRRIEIRAVEAELTPALMPAIESMLAKLADEGRAVMEAQGIPDPRALPRLHLRYAGTDTALAVDVAGYEDVVAAFTATYRQRFGFSAEQPRLILEAASVELVGGGEPLCEPASASPEEACGSPAMTVPLFTANTQHTAPVYLREQLAPGTRIAGPALVIEAISTIVIEPGWEAELTDRNYLILTRIATLTRGVAAGSRVDPVMLEIFNNRYVAIAEEMGYRLQNLSASVNIKERLDFSCAIFNERGDLVANAPHIPVHLGSMGESVKAIRERFGDEMRPGDVYLLNSPYHGGTHLPDVTVITPVFDGNGTEVRFYAASRGHHADVGGVTPGSMPPMSRAIGEEGVCSAGMRIVAGGRLDERAVRAWLCCGPYPARNPGQNLADLRAQIAANEKGVHELHNMVEELGYPTVDAYMGHVQDHAEEAVRRVIDVLKDGEFRYALDSGGEIVVRISVDRQRRGARIDFTGTSPQRPNNFNAPAAVTQAAVLYVFRTLVREPIPLNAGCTRPLEIIIPEGSMLNPVYPAAVVAGNVETSQYIVDALYGALGVMAASQGTMNNFSFGNERYQYYETVCGGSGAGRHFDGTDAVHTHMTNSRLTDPEVLEWRFPVRVESLAIRRESGGRGRHRGGDGVVRRIRFLETMTAAILSSHRVRPPFGLDGGMPGALGRNHLCRVDGTIIEIHGTAEIEVHAGDAFVIETPGGGGYGKEALQSAFTCNDRKTDP